MGTWVRACGKNDIESEDVLQFTHQDRVLAIYRSPDDAFYCTDGFCTHARVLLARGFVMDHIIECPAHNGQFDYRTGKALRSPACEDLVTHPAKLDGDDVVVLLD